MWAPIVGKVFKPSPESTISHGPGAKFTPDETGGGTLEFMVMETRKGFRSGLRKKVIRKNAYRADCPNP